MRKAFEAHDNELVERYAFILYGQSMLAEGLDIPDFTRYSNAVYALMQE